MFFKKFFVGVLLVCGLNNVLLYASDNSCINGERIEQGTGVPIEGDCVVPPQSYLEKHVCDVGKRLLQGTANSCVEGVEVEDPQSYPEKFVCGEGMRLLQGSVNTCIGTISGNIPLGNGSTLNILSFDGTELGSSTVDENGGYDLQIDMSLIVDGFIIEMSGGTLYGQEFNGTLLAIYSQGDNISQLNVTPITTLVAKMAMESSGGASIESRDEALQKLADMGMLKQEDWFEAEPSLVNMDQLRTVVQLDGLDVWLNGMITDLTDSQLERDKMDVFSMAHGGLLRAYTNEKVFIFPGDTKRVLVGGETNSSTSDENVTLSFEGEYPDWITIDKNAVVATPLETEESLQTISIHLNVTKNGIVIGRKVSFDLLLMEKVILVEGDIGVSGGSLFNEWKDISIKFNPDVLEVEHYFKLIAGLNNMGAISIQLLAEPELSDGEETGIHLTLPETEILRNNYFTTSETLISTSQTLNRSLRSIDTSSLITYNLKKICIDNETTEMEGFIFDNVWLATTAKYDDSFLTGFLNGGEPRSINGRGSEKCSSRLWSTNSISNASLISTDQEPVLLVHGFIKSGNLGSMDGAVYFGNFAKILESTNKYVPFEFEWRTNASFTDVAVELRRAVQMVAEKTGKKVHIAAHSFGGVLSRAMIQLSYNSKEFSEKNIASLTTVGSPHSGIFDTGTVVDPEFNALIDNNLRTFTFGDYPTYFSRGQDGIPGSLIDGCRAITCYQAGDNVTFLNNNNAFTKYGVLQNPGSVVYRLASTISDYPDVPTQVLIGLVPDIVGLTDEGNQQGKLRYRFTPYLGNISGDELISVNGQRIAPFSTSTVYQGGEISKNHIEEHVLHFKLIQDDEDIFNRIAYDRLLEVFSQADDDSYYTFGRDFDGYYDFTINKNEGENTVYIEENELLNYTLRQVGRGIYAQYTNLYGKYIKGFNHRTGQYSRIGHPRLGLSLLSEVGLQDCETAVSCTNPTWLYFKTFAESHPAQLIETPEEIVARGSVEYNDAVYQVPEVARNVELAATPVVPFPVTVEIFQGEENSIGANRVATTTLNEDGTYDANIIFEPDTRYFAAAYPSGNADERIKAIIRAARSSFANTNDTLEESTLNFPTITLTDNNYQEGDLNIKVTDGADSTVLNGFDAGIRNTTGIKVDDNTINIDSGYITTLLAKGDYTVTISKEGYDDIQKQCTVVAEETTECIVNIFPVGDDSILITDLVAGHVTFLDQDDYGMVSVPTDAWVRIVPLRYQVEGFYTGVHCKIDSNGDFGNECYIHRSESEMRSAFNDSSETFQVVVYAETTGNTYWEAEEDMYGFLGDDIPNGDWSNFAVVIRYVPTINITNKAIVLDGDVDDWIDVDSYATDSSGDSSSAYIGSDIRALYVAYDNEYLYLLLVLYDNANETFMNSPAPDDGRYTFSINDFNFGISFWESAWQVNGNGSGGTSTFSGEEFVAVKDNAIEIKIPLNQLDNIQAIDRIFANFENCCSENWSVLDSISL